MQQQQQLAQQAAALQQQVLLQQLQRQGSRGGTSSSGRPPGEYPSAGDSSSVFTALQRGGSLSLPRQGSGAAQGTLTSLPSLPARMGSGSADATIPRGGLSMDEFAAPSDWDPGYRYDSFAVLSWHCNQVQGCEGACASGRVAAKIRRIWKKNAWAHT